MPNYVEVIASCFPDSQATVTGGKDETVYANVDWITTPIPQATLDASVCANVPVIINKNEVSYEDAFGQVLVENFYRSSTSKNAWLSHNGVPTNDYPLIVPFNGKLVGMAFNNERTGVKTNIKVYVTPKGSSTAELAHSWEFRNGRLGFTNEVTQQVFESGAKVSVYLEHAGKAPKNVSLTLYMQVISAVPETYIE